MVTAEEFRDLARAYGDVGENAHFERTAFRVRRIFATLAGDGASANLLLAPDEQRFFCECHGEALAPVPNRFGARGWTTLFLSGADRALAKRLLDAAHANGARR